MRSTKSKLIFHKRQTANLVEAFLVALLGSDSWQRMCASLPHTHSRMYLHPHSQTHTHTHADLYKHLHAQKPQLISNARFMRLLCDLVLVLPQDVMASAERRVNCHAKQESKRRLGYCKKKEDEEKSRGKGSGKRTQLFSRISRSNNTNHAASG